MSALCVTTSGSPSSKNQQSPNQHDSIILLCPKTGSKLSSNSHNNNNNKHLLGSNLTVGSSSNLSCQSISSLHPINPDIYLCYGINKEVKSNNDTYAFLLRRGSNKPIWKCHLPEPHFDSGLKVSRDGRWLMGGGRSGRVYIWDMVSSGDFFDKNDEEGRASGDSNLVRVLTAHHRPIHALSFTTCGGFVLTGGADGVVHMWSIPVLVDCTSKEEQGGGGDGLAMISPVRTWSEHVLPVTCLYCLASTSSRALSCSTDRMVIIMDLCSGLTLGKISFPSGLNVVTVADDDVDDISYNKMYVGGTDGIIFWMDLDAYSAKCTAETSKLISSVGATKNNKRRKRLPSTSGSDLHETVLGEKGTSGRGAPISELRGHNGAITSLLVHNPVDSGTILVSGSIDGSLRIWDMATKCCSRVLYPWGQSSQCSVSNIISIPREPLSNIAKKNSFDVFEEGSKLMFAFSPKPLSKYPKTHEECSRFGESCTLLSTSVTGHHDVPIADCVDDDFWNKCLWSNNEDAVIADDFGNERIKKRGKGGPDRKKNSQKVNDVVPASTENEEIQRLQKELDEAKGVIKRWEIVNNKLMRKLKSGNK